MISGRNRIRMCVVWWYFPKVLVLKRESTKQDMEMDVCQGHPSPSDPGQHCHFWHSITHSNVVHQEGRYTFGCVSQGFLTSLYFLWKSHQRHLYKCLSGRKIRSPWKARRDRIYHRGSKRSKKKVQYATPQRMPERKGGCKPVNAPLFHQCQLFLLDYYTVLRWYLTLWKAKLHVLQAYVPKHSLPRVDVYNQGYLEL